MKRREVKISQSAFALMRETIARMELQGFGPDSCAMAALTAVGLDAPLYTETVLVVDPALDDPEAT